MIKRIASALLVVWVGGPAHGQPPISVALRPLPTSGVRVRIREFEPGSAPASVRRHEAEFVALSGDTLVVRMVGERSDAPIALERVATLEVRHKDRVRGFSVGLFAGILGGLASVAISGVPAGPEGPSDAIMVIGLTGGALGAAFGWNTWRPVSIVRHR